MRKLLIGGVAGLLAGCAMTGNDRTNSPGATAGGWIPLVAADGSRRGAVRLIQVHGGVSVAVRGENLPPGLHGAHIHAVGRCDAPDFASAGPHWNPTQRQHGRENPAGPHMGDIPNLSIGSDGRGSLQFEVSGAWTRAGEPRILDADGAAFVVHANADDNRTDPSGNSGGRIACAVLR
jgi:superoxide dismutase, Cu-Zn family